MDQFESKLMNKYEIRPLESAKHFLRIRIVCDRSQQKLWLVQDSYIDKMAKKYNITTNTKPPKSPLPSTELVPYEGTATAQQIYAYQQRVGSLNFNAVITRPDISKKLSNLQKSHKIHSQTHLQEQNRTCDT